MYDTSPGSKSDGTDGDGVSESERYELLANDRRRLAVRVLAERGEPLTLEDLASSVEAIETNDSPEDGDGTVIGLHHIHLPKLDEVGLVEYDPEENRVEPRLQDVDLGYA